MVSGKEAYSTLKSSKAQLESQYHEADSQVETARRSIHTLENEQDEIYIWLTQTWLPELDAESVPKTLTQLRGFAEEAWEKELAERQDLESSMRDIKAEIADLEERVKTFDIQIAEKSKEHKLKLKQTEAQLKEDAEYVKWKKDADALGRLIAQQIVNIEWFEQMSKEPIQKLRGNKYFNYLLDAGYGTKTRWPHRRILDRAVALYIDYSTLKKDYDGYTKMPEFLKAKSKEKQVRYEKICFDIEERYAQAGKSTGLTIVVEAGQKLEAEREQVIATINSLEEKHNRFSQRRTALNSSKDEYYESTRQSIHDYIQTLDINELMNMARQTKSSEDDMKVSRLEQIGNELAQLQSELEECIKTDTALSEKVGGLKNLERDYTSFRYHTERSYFPKSFNMQGVIDGFLTDSYGYKHAWDLIRAGQRFKEPAYSDTSSYSDTFRLPRSTSRTPSTISSVHIPSSVFSSGPRISFGGGYARIGGRI